MWSYWNDDERTELLLRLLKPKNYSSSFFTARVVDIEYLLIFLFDFPNLKKKL